MDYKAIGLTAGIEIHQQLNTKEKLFCHCPTLLRDSAEHSGEFFRYLRVTESEMGEIDRAAQEEMKRERKFQYYTYDTTCLVENDEEPPAPLNDEALSVCLTIAKMFGMTPVRQVHTMRKLVIDGSNTSGFQRTALVALWCTFSLLGDSVTLVMFIILIVTGIVQILARVLMQKREIVGIKLPGAWRALVYVLFLVIYSTGGLNYVRF